MDKQTKDKIDEILSEIREMRKDIDSLKQFKSRVLGGLAVFVFICNIMMKVIIG